jgi:hypothetical protein
LVLLLLRERELALDTDDREFEGMLCCELALPSTRSGKLWGIGRELDILRFHRRCHVNDVGLREGIALYHFVGSRKFVGQ